MNFFGLGSEPTMTAADSADARFAQVCEDLRLEAKLLSIDTLVDVDGKEFTMYRIEVTSGAEGGRGGTTCWVIQRRYSQFNELKTRLERLGGYADAVRGCTFPGKVLFNKTSAKVVEERKGPLLDWLNALLITQFTTNYHVNSFLEAVDDNILSAGEQLPHVTWKDASDQPLNTAELPNDQVIVMAAASYWTYQALTAFVDPCSDAAMSRYPNLPQFNVGISEMRLVPPSVRPQVKPVLAMLIKNAQKKLDDRADKFGIPKGTNALRFCFDFDGAMLDALRVKDCDWTWRVWLVHNGTVLASLRSSTPDAAGEFARVFDKVAAELQLKPNE